jgi:cytoskeletal protein CcmA (bactofilin family)
MFRKFKSPLERDEAVYQQERPRNPFGTDFVNAPLAHAPEEEDESEHETLIAEHVEIQGTLRFQKALRIDGRFEGQLEASGKLIIGPTGSVKANIDLDEAFISGKVIGNITVKKRLVLRGKAEVTGDITTPLLSVDEGVSIVGILNVVNALECIDKR